MMLCGSWQWAAAQGWEIVEIDRRGATGEVPWTVFAEKSLIHAEPDALATAVGFLHKGEKVSGRYLVTEADEEWLEVDLGQGEDAKGYIPRIVIQRVHPANDHAGNLEIGMEVVDRWWGLRPDYEPSDLVTLPATYTDGRQQMLRKEAAEAMIEMLEAARADGLEIIVGSSYRSFERQKQLYAHAVSRGSASQRYSAPPGHSEHQLGTTVDLADASKKFYLSQLFGERPEGAWLKANAGRFGYVLSYTPENTNETGYIQEPWHYRYMGRPAVTETGSPTGDHQH